MEREKLETIRQKVERLSKDAESLRSEANDFPAILRNTRRLEACIRMMEMALGQITLTPEKGA